LRGRIANRLGMCPQEFIRSLLWWIDIGQLGQLLGSSMNVAPKLFC
jgi:hypothetical protein